MQGGANRISILRSLREQPKNANQLATELDLNYKTVRHHLGLLTDHGLVTTTNNQYGKLYFTTDEFAGHQETFERITADVDSGNSRDNEKHM
ncbi:ArsR/SmtB family transcription factor [Halalkalicoccus subterraneus]|uniref:ArsR/SmtB family transcription factor n=1 Tax=Halalkalicoccus subterraneus TaxID=2675002 RepID=UPI0037438BE0